MKNKLQTCFIVAIVLATICSVCAPTFAGATFRICTSSYEMLPPQPTQPTPPINPKPSDNSESVLPRPHTPTIPPGYMVDRGEVSIGLYVDCTFPFGTLPTIFTVYLFTVDKGKVYFSVNYTISVEGSAAWKPVEGGNVMNGTVNMPGGYSMEYNARIAHMIDKAALLANQRGTPVIVGFYGWARRLDTNKTCSAYLAVPVLPNHIPVKPAASVTFHVYDAVTRKGIAGANVTMSGPAHLTGLTNSTGYLTFANVRNGTYTVTVSATGYQTFSTIVTVARDMLLNMPLLPVNAANLSALLVKVRTRDGVPVQGASVYVNGTLVGYTDSYGEWGASYPWGAKLNVTLTYGSWRGSQLAEMVYPRVLLVFEYPGQSGIFKPQVSAIYVQAADRRVGKNRGTALLCAVMVNSNNTYAAEIGFKKDGRVVSKTVVTRSPSRSMLDIFTVAVNVTETGTLVPYLNVTWAAADSDPRDNYVEGEPIRGVTPVYVAIGITREVERWGLDVPGLIYPGSTVFRINVSIWVVGPPGLAGKIGLAKPMKMRAFLNYRLVSAYSQPLGNVTVWELGNGTVLSVLVTCPYARYMSPILLVDDRGNATEDYELSITTPSNLGEYELPPHVIVLELLNVTPKTLKPGDKFNVTLRVWTNLLPGEGSDAMIYLSLEKQRAYIVHSKAPIGELVSGEQVVTATLTLPADYNYNFIEGQSVTPIECTLMVGGVPDSYFGDNVVNITLNVLNTSRASEPARDAWRTFTLALIAALAACAAACGYAIYRRRRLAGIIAPTKIR